MTRDESAGAQAIEQLWAGIRDVRQSSDCHWGTYPAQPTRVEHLCIEQLAGKKAIQESLPRRNKIKSSQRMAHLSYVDDAHIRVDTTKGNGKHAAQIGVREKDKGHQITQGEDAGEESRLDGTTNKSIQNCIRVTETSSRTGEYDGQSNW